MTSFIVISKNKQTRETYVKKFCEQQSIAPVDITILERETAVKKNTQSIGIEEIKILQKKLFLKPIKSLTKAVIIEETHLLTTEAQNALLKVLEEPPEHTIIILAGESKEPLLPTIISRCRVIELEKETIKITSDEREEYTHFILNLPSMPIGERLKRAEVLAKDKDKALVWIEKLILILRAKVLELELVTPSPLRGEGRGEGEKVGDESKVYNSSIKLIKTFQRLHTTLKTTNVNARFAIEITLLNTQ